MKFIKRADQLILTIDHTWDGKHLSDFFEAYHFSKKNKHLLHQYKNYTLNHEYVYDAPLKTGDLLSLKAYERDDGMYRPVFEDLDIVYEDDLLLIVNKPPFLPVYPAHQEDTQSLANYVSGYYASCGLDLPVRFIHRLDDDTSGLVIFCKSYLFQSYLDEMLKRKAIHRHYLAFTKGTFPDQKIHTIDADIARDRHNAKKMRVAPHGSHAITHYQCLENHSNYALVKCILETGRRHQIRVHMASIQHPLLGDPLYGKPFGSLHRQALHAYAIALIHPLTGEQLLVKSNLPPDLQSLTSLRHF